MVLGEQMAGCGTNQAQIGMSLLGLCSALFLETLVFLQTLCVYFNKMNPKVRSLPRCVSPGEAVLAGEQA